MAIGDVPAGIYQLDKNAQWFIDNAGELLGKGQIAHLEGDTGEYKKGDGVRTIGALPWLGGGGGGAVNSVTGTANRISVDNTDPANPIINIGFATGSTAQYFRGDLSLATFPTNVSSFTNDSGYEVTSAKGAANGYVPLDSSSKIPTSYLPALAITDTFVVSSQAAMLALTAERGDVAVRTDQNKSYILAGDNPAILANWQELLTPTDTVLSVNGMTGAVPLTGTANRVTVSAANVFDIAATYIGQGSITTVGALTSGSIAAGFTSISTGFTDAKIKGAVAATVGLIPFGTGISDTVSTNAALFWDGANSNGLTIDVPFNEYAQTWKRSGNSKWNLNIDGADQFRLRSVTGAVEFFFGTAGNFGIRVSNPSAALTLPAGTTAIPQIKLTAGVAPTGGALTDGVFWFDGTDVKIRISGVTKTFTLT